MPLFSTLRTRFCRFIACGLPALGLLLTSSLRAQNAAPLPDDARPVGPAVYFAPTDSPPPGHHAPSNIQLAQFVGVAAENRSQGNSLRDNSATPPSQPANDARQPVQSTPFELSSENQRSEVISAVPRDLEQDIAPQKPPLLNAPHQSSAAQEEPPRLAARLVASEPVAQAGPFPTAPPTPEIEPEGTARKSDYSMLDKRLNTADTGKKKGVQAFKESAGSRFAPFFSTLGGLLLVLGLFFLFVFLMRRVSPKGNLPLPKELAEHLGRIPLTQKVQLHLLRIGDRLVLLSVTVDGATPITEITDPDEVVRLLGFCRKHDGQGSSAAFQQVLSGYMPTEDAGDKKAAGNGRSAESLTGLLAAGLSKTPPTRGKAS